MSSASTSPPWIESRFRRKSLTSRRSSKARCTGPIHWPVDPQAVALVYLDRFERLGGRFLQGNAATLQPTATDGTCAPSTVRSPRRDAVVALGPWADAVTRRARLRPALRGEARLPHALPRRRRRYVNHPMLDTERGYFLAPMRRGIRLTTGAEFALRDGMKTPVQTEPRRADRARAVPARRSPRSRPLDGLAPLHAGHDAGDRRRAAPPRLVVRLRPRAPWPYARPGRPAG